jgi:cysteinyl-tRNA synthetase
MSLRVYNTLSKQKEPFVPVRPGKVGIYVCGPTVYKPPHIGHMVGPVIFDAIKRYLAYKGFEVTLVINITDVDDKLIEAANRAGVTVPELAARYTAEYLQCLERLGVDTVDRFPKASEHIPEIVDTCSTLIASGHAYEAAGNVWFSVGSDPDYGKLSNRKVEEQESGLRELEGAGKRHPADFALWKTAKPGEPAWDSPWGAGRPGWHIECTVMSMKYLGQTLDMHGGGLDLVFPHHENELAQSESVSGVPFVKFWMHNGLTRVRTKSASGEWKDEKISGSELVREGNEGMLARLSAKALLDQHGGELIRYMLLSTHYRRPIEFTEDVLTMCRKGLSVFKRLSERVERLAGPAPDASWHEIDQRLGEVLRSEDEALARALLAHKSRFLDMMDDDFNTAGAIGVLHELAGELNAFIERSGVEKTRNEEQASAALSGWMLLRGLGRIMGMFRGTTIGLGEGQGGSDEMAGKLIALLLEVRQMAREARQFSIADAVRNKLSDLGITVEDRAGGTTWRKD